MNLLLLRANDKILYPKFAKYYFDTDLFKIQLYKISNQSVNQSSFSLSKLKNLIIPLLPLPIQKRIAEILDAADALKRKDQELLKKYDELAQAIFINMFGDPVKNEKGWEVKRFDEVVEFPSGLVDPKILPYSKMFHIGGDYIPSWCTVNTYNGYFTVTASANPESTRRNDWFKVTAGGKEVIINVEQFGRTNQNSPKSEIVVETPIPPIPSNKCFNCPKTYNTWGLTLGYAQKSFNNSLMDCAQFGLKIEPLFKYGFGLNTGLIFEGCSQSMFNEPFFQNGFNYYGVNVPLHLEYRWNISKLFNIFAYGGAGFNAITDPNFDNYDLPVTFEYGGGFRISHVQFNVGKSLYLGNLKNLQNFGKNKETYQKFILSVSYMF